MDSADVGVTILCFTYNHRDYIERALDGFVSQVTSFNYEIMICDDCSTDGTREILLSYKNKYPDLFDLRLEDKNLFWSDKYFSTYRKHVRSARGKYIALCEGDDYWINNNKLQMQYDVLENHPEIDMCATGCLLWDANGHISESRFNFEHDRIIKPKEVIKKGASLFQTATLMYRRRIYCGELPPFRRTYDTDLLQQIDGALRGGAYYLAEKTAVYKSFSSEDSWTGIVYSSEDNYNKLIGPLMDSLREMDEYTNHRYTVEISGIIKDYEYQKNVYWKKYKDILNDERMRKTLLARGDESTLRNICDRPELFGKIPVIQRVELYILANSKYIRIFRDKFMKYKRN